MESSKLKWKIWKQENGGGEYYVEDPRTTELRSVRAGRSKLLMLLDSPSTKYFAIIEHHQVPHKRTYSWIDSPAERFMDPQSTHIHL